MSTRANLRDNEAAVLQGEERALAGGGVEVDVGRVALAVPLEVI